MEYFIYYLIGINILTYLLYGIDKAKASKNAWRIPEKYLFLFTFLGGSLGAILAMKQFHHKTKKSEFKNVIFIILLVQFVLASFIIYQIYFKA